MTGVCQLMLCGFYLFVHSGIQLKFECQLSGLLYVSPSLLYLEIFLSWLMSPPGHIDEGMKGGQPWIHTFDPQPHQERPSILVFYVPHPRTLPSSLCFAHPFQRSLFSSLPPTHAEFIGEKNMHFVIVAPLTGGSPLGIVAVARSVAHAPLALCTRLLCCCLPPLSHSILPVSLRPHPPTLCLVAPPWLTLSSLSFLCPSSLMCTGNCIALP